MVRSGARRMHIGTANDAPATATLGGGRTVTVGPEAQACVEPIFSTRSYAMDGSGVGLAIAVHEAVVR